MAGILTILLDHPVESNAIKVFMCYHTVSGEGNSLWIRLITRILVSSIAFIVIPPSFSQSCYHKIHIHYIYITWFISYVSHEAYQWLTFAQKLFLFSYKLKEEHLCGIVVRVPDHRPVDLGFYSRWYQTLGEVVGLERDALRLLRITEEIIERKCSGSGLENRDKQP